MRRVLWARGNGAARAGGGENAGDDGKSHQVQAKVQAEYDIAC